MNRRPTAHRSGHRQKRRPSRVSHRPHSHRLTVRPGPRNGLLPPPLRPNASIPPFARPSATGSNCPGTATVQRNRSAPGVLVSRTAHHVLRSGLTISSALGLRACHFTAVCAGSARCRAQSSRANRWRSSHGSGDSGFGEFIDGAGNIAKEDAASDRIERYRGEVGESWPCLFRDRGHRGV
jgi:hypothetical protein